MNCKITSHALHAFGIQTPYGLTGKVPAYAGNKKIPERELSQVEPRGVQPKVIHWELTPRVNTRRRGPRGRVRDAGVSSGGPLRVEA